MNTYFKKKRLVDKKYLQSAKGKPCIICRATGTTVMHHILYNSPNKGKGIKPSDNHVIPLCHKCHDTCHRGEKRFYDKYAYILTENPIKFAEQLYIKFKTHNEEEQEERCKKLATLLKSLNS